MFFILKEAAAVILLSLLTIGVMGFLLYLLPNAVSARYDFMQLKPLAVLALCLLFCLGESLCLFGAVRARKQIDRTRATVEQLAGSAADLTRSELAQLVEEQLPLAERYIDSGNQAIDFSQNYVTDYIDTLRRQVSRYMWRRIGWLTGFFLLGAALLWHDAETQRRRRAAYAAFLQSDY